VDATAVARQQTASKRNHLKIGLLPGVRRLGAALVHDGLTPFAARKSKLRQLSVRQSGAKPVALQGEARFQAGFLLCGEVEALAEVVGLI
jgi:hypothetical protein